MIVLVHLVPPACQDFVYYLADFTAGLGTDIYEVTLNGSDADMSFIAYINDEVHIAYNVWITLSMQLVKRTMSIER